MIDVNPDLVRKLYAKYNPGVNVEEKLSYIQKKYGDDQDSFVKSFYAKYAPDEDVDSKLEYINKSYPIKKKEESTSTNTELVSEPKVKTTNSDLPKQTENTNEEGVISETELFGEKQKPENSDPNFKNPPTLKANSNFEKDQYSLSERSGLSTINKETGGFEDALGNEKTERVNIDGYDNDLMNSITVKMRETGILTNEDLKIMDSEIDRKKRGDFTLGEKFKHGIKKNFSLIGDLLGVDSEQERKQFSSYDRADLIDKKIQKKQSEFFDNLDSEEKEVFESYLVKRNDKLTKDFKIAISSNENINEQLIPKELEGLKSLKESLGELQKKDKKEITEDDVQSYNQLLKEYNGKVDKIQTLERQFASNRKLIINNNDDILTFDKEIDLAKRDYSFEKNRVQPITNGVLDIITDAGLFTANLFLDAVINNAGEEDFLMDAKKSLQDASIKNTELKRNFKKGIRIRQSVSESSSISEVAVNTLDLLIDQAPIIATIAATGGAGLVIVSAHSGEDRRGNLLLDRKNGFNNYTYSQIDNNAMMYATGEGVGESVTYGLLKNYKRLLKSANRNGLSKATFREGVTKAINGTYKGISTANKEGLSELYTEWIQASSDNAGLDQKRKINAFEVYISGFVMGGGIHIAGTLPNMAISSYSKKQNRKKVSENVIKITEYKKLLSDGDFTKEISDLYNSKIQSLRNENDKIINESLDDIKNLSPKDITKITAINSQVKAIQVALQEKGKTEFESKEDIKKSLLSEISDLSNQKDAILENAKSNKFNALSPQEKIKAKEDAQNVLVKEKQDAGETEFKITDAEITEKANELSNKKPAQQNRYVPIMSRPKTASEEVKTLTGKEAEAGEKTVEKIINRGIEEGQDIQDIEDRIFSRFGWGINEIETVRIFIKGKVDGSIKEDFATWRKPTQQSSDTKSDRTTESKDDDKKGIKTGKPLNLTYNKNNEKAPRKSTEFGQDVEPSGDYVTQSFGFTPEGLTTGKVKIKNPLVIEITSETQISYKYELSKKYGGKKGKELTDAIKKEGYDAIITKYDDGSSGEIILIDNQRQSETQEKGDTTANENIQSGNRSDNNKGKDEVAQDLTPEQKAESKPQLKMNFVTKTEMTKSAHLNKTVTVNNRIKEDYKEIKKLLDCLWK